MMTTLTAVLLAGILGMVGQGARAVIGLKQLADAAKGPKASNPEQFSAARLVISLIIGFIAGILAAMALGLLDATKTMPAFDNKIMLGLIASGYAGTDVIEGFMSKYVPQTGAGGDAPLPLVVPMQASLAGLQVAASAAVAGDQVVRAACEAEWEGHKSDCSGFVRAVAARLGAEVVGNADAITTALSAGAPWSTLQDGPAAAAAARQGRIVVAGLRGADQVTPDANGHVVIVVDGKLNREKYPHAYWGKLNGVGAKDQTINFAWKETDRDHVVYAAYDP